ncbi:MAG: SDR family oxidoreductase [Pseudomonadota bacterium]|nr:SDR family oxidoreductase [Pseudomonadota bacterium]
MTSSSRTALVTGASSGIGLALADLLADDGIALVVTARKLESLRPHVERWRACGIDVLPIAVDLAEPGAAERLHAQVVDAGIEIDFLINNAGVGLFGEFVDSDLQAGLAMARLNMLAPTELAKRFLPQLLARGGRIMNVASAAAFQPGPYMAVYFATKAYLLSWSEALAEELSGRGVTVTAFCPGLTASGFQEKAAMQESRLVKGQKLPTSASVAAEGYRAMLRGRRVYVPGNTNWLMTQSVRFTPRRVVTRLMRLVSAPN